MTQSPQNVPSDDDLAAFVREQWPHQDDDERHDLAAFARAILAKYAAPATVGVPDAKSFDDWLQLGQTLRDPDNLTRPELELAKAAYRAASPTSPAGEGQEPEYYDSEKRCRAYYESGLRPYLCDGMRYDHWQAVWMAAQFDMSMRPNNSSSRPHPAPQAAQPAASVEPAFYGFMDTANCRVDICYTPSAPRNDGVYATAYYTAPVAANPAQAKPMLGASTHEQIFSALDEAHQFGGPPHERIRQLVESRQQLLTECQRAAQDASKPAQDERGAFEAWNLAGCEMVDDPANGRMDIARHCAWSAWQARAAIAAMGNGTAK